MGYRLDLDEYREDQLLTELTERYSYRARGLCDYCHRHSDQPSCKFWDRHAMAQPSGFLELDATRPKRELYGEVSKVDPAGHWAEVRIFRGAWIRAYGPSASKLVVGGQACVIEQADNTGVMGYFLE